MRGESGIFEGEFSWGWEGSQRTGRIGGGDFLTWWGLIETWNQKMDLVAIRAESGDDSAGLTGSGSIPVGDGIFGWRRIR
jgi:hypothetical protein